MKPNIFYKLNEVQFIKNCEIANRKTLFFYLATQ